MTLNIAYIGFGKSAKRYHLPYVLIRENINVKTIYSRTRHMEEELDYSEYNIHFTDNIEDVLNDEDIDLVVITTPSSTHYEWAKKALVHKKNVLVEKPFCLNLKDASELLDLAEQNNCVCLPFQNRRFDSDYLTTKKVIESGVLGELIEVESHFDYYRPEVNANMPNSKYGAFYGLGVHTIDQMIALFGKPDVLYTDVRRLRDKNIPDDTFEVQMFYGDLKVIVKTSHLIKSEYPKFIVHGKLGSFIKYGIDQQETCLKAYYMPGEHDFGVDPVSAYGTLNYLDKDNVEHIEKVVSEIGDYGLVYDELVEILLHKKDAFITKKQILDVMEILELGIQSNKPQLFTLK